MNRTITFLFIVFFFTIMVNVAMAQEVVGTVTDFDGNIYHEVVIGNQTWLQENIKSLHYSDGTPIPGVAVYNDDESMAEIYGRLYTWQAAMRNSIQEGVQGVAPEGYHVASDAEWTELENFLGGANLAGGKMKTTGTEHWNSPNTGATNSSGFSALPAGEYDAHYAPNKFQLLNEYAVFWTSTQISSQLARERFLSFNSNASQIYDWYKTMKYSIRCIKDAVTDTDDEAEQVPKDYNLGQNYPNPFNPSTKITYTLPGTTHVTLTVYDTLGRKISTLLDEDKSAGTHEINFLPDNLSSGFYFYQLKTPYYMESKKMLLIR